MVFTVALLLGLPKQQTLATQLPCLHVRAGARAVDLGGPKI